jgi:hypothetical protein
MGAGPFPRPGRRERFVARTYDHSATSEKTGVVFVARDRSWPAAIPSGSFSSTAELLKPGERRWVLGGIERDEPVLSRKITGPEFRTGIPERFGGNSVCAEIFGLRPRSLKPTMLPMARRDLSATGVVVTTPTDNALERMPD